MRCSSEEFGEADERGGSDLFPTRQAAPTSAVQQVPVPTEAPIAHPVRECDSQQQPTVSGGAHQWIDRQPNQVLARQLHHRRLPKSDFKRDEGCSRQAADDPDQDNPAQPISHDQESVQTSAGYQLPQPVEVCG